jgi:hypothetical protein
MAVLRQILSALKNSEIPCRDGCPIQVIPFTLERQESLPEQRPRDLPVYIYIKDGGTQAFHVDVSGRRVVDVAPDSRVRGSDARARGEPVFRSTGR